MNRTEAVEKIREMQQIADRFELCITDHNRLVDEHTKQIDKQNQLVDEHNQLVDEHCQLVDMYKKRVASHATVCDELSAVGIGDNRPEEFRSLQSGAHK